MDSTLTAAVISACLCGAILLGMQIRRLLPQDHLAGETKEAVKVAVGLIATMSALLLGLLVSSAKDSYDTVRSEVIQMAAKIRFLDRMLDLQGTEAAPLRAKLHTVVETTIQEMWSEHQDGKAPDVQAADALHLGILGLSVRDDALRVLKEHATGIAVEIAQLRTLLRARSLASIARPLLVMVVLWLMIIFLSFSMLAPPNTTARFAMMVSALSVTGAIFLILEMDRPFTGLIRISSEPMLNALSRTTR